MSLTFQQAISEKIAKLDTELSEYKKRNGIESTIEEKYFWMLKASDIGANKVYINLDYAEDTPTEIGLRYNQIFKETVQEFIGDKHSPTVQHVDDGEPPTIIDLWTTSSTSPISQ